MTASAKAPAVRAQSADINHRAVVDGRVVALGGIRFSTQQSLAMQENVERYAAGMRDDIVDLLT